MKALKYIFLLLLIAVVAFSVYVAVQPNEYNFSRSRTIAAPSELIFNKVNDFKNWPSFSPWIEKEPEAKLSFGETTAGVNATYGWKGDVLGEGSMKTLEVLGDTAIKQKIIFIKPFEAESHINWHFKPSEKGTEVTWHMNGKKDFLTKVMTTFMGSIESSTGPDFERGLFKLDSIVTNDMNQYNITVNGVTEHSGGFYLYNSTSCKFSNFNEKMAEQFPKIINFAMANNITMAGKPFVIYHKWDEANDAVIFSCAVPTSSKITTDNPEVLTGQLSSFKALKTTLKGDYKNLKEAWDKTMEYLLANNINAIENGTALESYVLGPQQSKNPADWKTEIFIAIE